jgi:hypothetical protein
VVKKLIPLFAVTLVLVFGSCVWAQESDNDSHEIQFLVWEGAWLVVDSALGDPGESPTFWVMIDEYAENEFGGYDDYGYIVAIGEITVDIRYSSILPAEGTARKVIMEIDDSPPAGLQLMAKPISIGIDSDGQGGTYGSFAWDPDGEGAKPVTAGDSLELVTGIGSVELATLTVSLTVDIVDVAALYGTDKIINAIYTLTAAE